MSRRIIITGVFLIALLITNLGYINGADNTNPNPFDSGPETSRVMPLGRGVNMGDMLDAPNEGEWGETIQEEYFSLIKNKGFDSVRIPIRWSNHALATEPYTIDSDFFNRVDQVVNWALAQNLKVIIDIHHYQEIMYNPEGQKNRFLMLWKQIASHYKKAPNSLYYELLNEPCRNLDKDTWNKIIAETVKTIRAVDKTHTLIIGGVDWNSTYSLINLKIPAGEKKVIATFHFYAPFNFTHQGADWVNPIPMVGVKWPGDNAATACQAIRDELDFVRIWSRAHKNIPVLLGEFGAFSKGDITSRANWTAYVRKQAETMGFSWTYWEFCARFGVYDDTTRQWNQPLVEALGLNP